MSSHFTTFALPYVYTQFCSPVGSEPGSWLQLSRALSQMAHALQPGETSTITNVNLLAATWCGALCREAIFAKSPCTYHGSRTSSPTWKNNIVTTWAWGRSALPSMIVFSAVDLRQCGLGSCLDPFLACGSLLLSAGNETAGRLGLKSWCQGTCPSSNWGRSCLGLRGM